MPLSDFERALRVLTGDAPPGERALAAAFLSAEFNEIEKPGSPISTADPAQRMFGYGERHEPASFWDGRTIRSGTITYAREDRIEQYVGRNSWIAYDPAMFGDTLPQEGDQIRISPRRDSVQIERIGPNRLGSGGSRQASSGMQIVRDTSVEPDEIAAAAQAVARRYSAAIKDIDGGCVLDFSGGAELRVRTVPEHGTRARVEVCVRTDRPDEARDAECALILCAALLTPGTGATAFDDSGAAFETERLYALAASNGMRGDWFGFVASAAQRRFPYESAPLFEEFCDELTVFSSDSWTAAQVQQALGQSLELFGRAAAESVDPGIPDSISIMEPNGEPPGQWQCLFKFFYEAALVWVGVREGPDERRPDVGALLGKPVSTAVLFGTAAPGDPQDERTALELRRADAFVTALAAGFMKSANNIASDGSGRLFSGRDLMELALYRQGRGLSRETSLQRT